MKTRLAGCETDSDYIIAVDFDQLFVFWIGVFRFEQDILSASELRSILVLF